ncbi:MAG TPA: Gfo/Idh/MocA family oxidoreductase [Tepidisphaeraceae bacterium]|jgi:glucose-fructose oxidoreductase
MKPWRIAGINFDHMHMGDLLRMAHEHPEAEIVAICDDQPERMQSAISNFEISNSKVFTDYRAAIEQSQPDLIILCPKTSDHALWVERVAGFNTNVLVEKPFAANLADADRMVRAMQSAGKQLIINWPLRWVASHATTKRLIDQGAIGDVIEVHYYDGNRGPLRHVADKVTVSEEIANSEKSKSWWYRKESGGGSLLDYLGYGTTLGTWFMNGRIPIEVTAVVDQPAGLEVDEHAVVVARYETGLSKFETRWGTFTDPWTHQPQPKCGFVIVGARGTISSYDYQPTIRVQTRDNQPGADIPADPPAYPYRNPIEYTLDCLENHRPVEGPLSPAIARIGQQIVDSAVLSAQQQRTVPLVT